MHTHTCTDELCCELCWVVTSVPFCRSTIWWACWAYWHLIAILASEKLKIFLWCPSCPPYSYIHIGQGSQDKRDSPAISSLFTHTYRLSLLFTYASSSLNLLFKVCFPNFESYLRDCFEPSSLPAPFLKRRHGHWAELLDSLSLQLPLRNNLMV